MALRTKEQKTPRNKFFIDSNVFEQSKAVIIGRAEPLGIEIVEGDWSSVELDQSFFAALVQYPNKLGNVEDYKTFTEKLHENDQMMVVAADILSLALLKSPGSWGADVVVGSTQRLGVPMGYGGPHAAYYATSEKYKRQIPGRIIGVSQDRHGNRALRMALQTREQHIKREKATSNICTAQALLAIMASMYTCYHGPKGIKSIANSIYQNTCKLYQAFRSENWTVLNHNFFDTISVSVSAEQMASIKEISEKHQINFYYGPDFVSISLDETVSEK